MKFLKNLLLIAMVVLLIGCAGIPDIKIYRHNQKNALFEKSGFKPQVELSAEYILGPADEIEIKIWGHEDLYQSLTIPANGTATFFPVGQIKVAGLTTSKLEEAFKEKLKDYLKETPSVTVMVKEYNSYKIYVLGEVAKPGLYPYGKKISVLEAITMAGAYTNRAEISHVRVVRIDKDNSAVARALIINLKDIMMKGDVTQNVTLRPGDIVFVPGSFMTGIDDALGRVLPGVSTIYYVDALAQ